MELRFGTHVRSGGRRLRYLAGLEVDPASRSVTKIILSDDGKLGAHALTRPLWAVRVDGRSLSVEDSATGVTVGQPILWSRSVRLTRGGREIGRLAGAVLRDDGAVEAVLTRQHWWSKRTRFAAADLDVTAPGEIRVASERSRAA